MTPPPPDSTRALTLHGRPAGDPSLARSEGMRVMLRPGEFDDLSAIAKGWDIPRASVGWAIISDWLGGLRNSRCDLGEVGIAIAAAQRLRPPVKKHVEPEPAEVEA